MTVRMLRRGAAAVLLLLAVSGAPARATTFANLTVEQFTDASTYIVEGEVLRVWTELEADTGLVWTRAEVRVSETHKGPSRAETLVIDSLGGRHGDVVVHVPGQAVFSAGEQVFLFLDQTRTGRLVPVSKYQGKLTLRRAPGERRLHAMTWQTSGERYDHRFLPPPPVESRIYVDDLRERVQQRLIAGSSGRRR